MHGQEMWHLLLFKLNEHNTANSNKEGSDQSSSSASDSVIRAINWEFNAWGGNVDGLYASWEKDNAFASAFADQFGFDWYDAAPFVLEGGSSTAMERVHF